MTEFTKEEISLCKQVAKKHRKEVKCGDWILRNDKLVLNLDGKLAWSDDAKQDIIITITTKIETIPLWTISDCLEFLIEKGYDKILNFMYFPEDKWMFTAESFVVEAPYHKVRGEGKTRLASCLKAILAVRKGG